MRDDRSSGRRRAGAASSGRVPERGQPLRLVRARQARHNLPVQLTSFVGREQEIAEVKRLLGTTRLLTLTGAGGVGKSRLAHQVGAELVEEYPDGVWLVELAALGDSALVPLAAASALGVAEQPGRPPIETVSDFLRPRSLVLVLDNCEHLLDACAVLADSLLRASRRLRVLATSRQALGMGGETAWRVPSLAMPDPARPATAEQLVSYEAARLFVERAKSALPTFGVTKDNAAAVAAVCWRLDGIPLAIELAAARVGMLTVRQIEARLDDRYRLLTGGSRTVLPRHQTLRGLVDWSHDLLSEPERVLLRRLSVFAGGWTLEAAEAVCAFGAGEGSCDDVLELLSELAAKSLVLADEQNGQMRYRFLETIRQYGAERLRASGEEAVVRDRHLEWFLALAERGEPELRGPDQVRWLDRLEAEHDNLRAALAWSQLESSSERARAAGLRLAGALSWFWRVHSQFSEGRR